MSAWKHLFALPLRMMGKRTVSCRRHQLPTVHQQGVMANIIRRTIADGWIDALTAQRMGTTDARKMFTRMRRMGVLFEADDIWGHKLVRNASGQGSYRRHRWTGEYPPGWPEPAERRKIKRGGR